MCPERLTMKSLLAISLVLSSLSVMAQNPFPQDFPFPYNPDGNADGYIGLNDMLDLLSVYGQQYPESFYTDSSAAILNLGLMPPHVCIREARLAGPKWRMMTYDDYWNHFDLLAEVGQQWFDNEQTSNDNYFYFFYAKDAGIDDAFLQYARYSPGGLISSQQNSQDFQFDVMINDGGMSNGTSAMLEHQDEHCLLVTEVYPQIEYHIVAGNYDYVTNAVNDSISNGWILQGGVSGPYSDNYRQAIWKYAE